MLLFIPPKLFIKSTCEGSDACEVGDYLGIATATFVFRVDSLNPQSQSGAN